MNAILYNFINHKKINGTLFYCFEYFVFLKDLGIDITYIIVDISSNDLMYVKDTFKNKYIFNEKYLDDIIGLKKRTDIYKLNIKNIITLDTRSLSINRFFFRNAKIFPYASHNDSNNLPFDFYGWYSYQMPWKYKTRLKLYKDIHKKFKKIDNKIFFSSLNVDYFEVQHLFPYKSDDIIQKHRTKSVDDLFSKISKVIYYGSEIDVNNRIVVECYIHDIEFELYNEYDDSVRERLNLINEGKAHELFLTKDDILIKDFIENITS